MRTELLSWMVRGTLTVSCVRLMLVLKLLAPMYLDILRTRGRASLAGSRICYRFKQKILVGVLPPVLPTRRYVAARQSRTPANHIVFFFDVRRGLDGMSRKLVQQ